MDRINAAIIIAGLILCFCGGVSLGRRGTAPQYAQDRPDTVYIVRDSITVDTVYLTEYRTRVLPVVRTDTVSVTDTVLEQVIVPYSTYVTEEPGVYHIEATGYDVTFDRVEYYPQVLVRKEVETVSRKTRWGLGLQAGYGLSSAGLSPYIGVGISYNILSW